MSSDPRAAFAPSALSRLGPFRHASFTALWTATIVSNIGGWMSATATGWLMTDLNPDPFVVSLVQVAVTLPMFLLAIPAGALTDIVDLRRLLVDTEIAITVISAAFALVVSLGIATTGNLLLFAFLSGVVGALQAPAWQAVVPQLVPAQSLQGAIAANAIGINITRAVGPALGGVILANFGPAIPFWVNAVSYLGMVAVLLWWRPPQRARRQLPVEQFGSAIRTGFRHARNNPHLQAAIIRAAALLLFASAYWALLPLIAREQIAGGTGTIRHHSRRHRSRRRGRRIRLALAGIETGPQLVGRGGNDRHRRRNGAVRGGARPGRWRFLASVIAGAAWTMAVATLNVSAQVALPDWVRGRGLGDVRDDFFRRHGGWQRHLGSDRRYGRTAGRSIHCSSGRACGHSPDLAL